MMKLIDVVKGIRERLPIELVSDQDNVGLIAGDYDDECDAMMVAYELNDGVVEEATQAKSNLVVTYHTPLYRAAKSFTTSTTRPDSLFHAVRSGLNIFSVHTALDVVRDGINFDLSRRLGLTNLRTLAPLSNSIYKIVVFVPQDHVGIVRDAMARSGAGRIGNYTECSFSSEGEGTFLPGDGSSPYIGNQGKRELTRESRLEMVAEKTLVGAVVDSMLKAHPYEEVAYDLYPLSNASVNYGFGAIGELAEPVSAAEFLGMVKRLLGLVSIKVSHLSGGEIRNVAVCAGSGASYYGQAVREGADLFITGDVKHHDFREASVRRTMLADATHAGTEKFAGQLLHDILKQAFEDRIVVNLSKHDYDGAVIV